jgi:hypothetical protein
MDLSCAHTSTIYRYELQALNVPGQNLDTNEKATRQKAASSFKGE